VRSRPMRTLARRIATLATVAVLALPAVPATPATAAPPRTVTLHGTVRQVIDDDFRTGTSRADWFVRTAAGRVPLVVSGGGLPALNGLDAVITGTRLPDGRVRVESVAPGASAAAATPGAASGATQGATPAAEAWSGPSIRHIAVVAATYTDLPTPPGVIGNLAPALTGADDSIRSLFEAASRGRVTVEADTFGPWALGFDSCSVASTFTATADAVEAAAVARGIDLARYDDVIMWTPPPCGDSWVALGEAPGTWIQVGAPYPDTLDSRVNEFAWTTSHEMGHNLGLMHANALKCTAGATRVPIAAASSCTSLEYGDPFSTMGGGQGYDAGTSWGYLSPLMDAGELERLGWLDPGEVQVATAGGTYDLVPVYGAAAGVRLLKIRRSTPVLLSDPALSYWTLRSGWLEIELRGASPDGTWDTIPTPDPVPVGVIVRYVEDGFTWSDLGAGPQDGPSYLVDAHAATTWNDIDDPGLLDAPLAPGDPVSITDPAGATIATVTATGSGARVSLSFSSGPPAAPSFGTASVTGVTPGNASAVVSWSAATGPAGKAVSGYTVRSYPGGRECYALADQVPLRCTVEGLANDVPYRFTVTAAFMPGSFWSTSAPSDPATPTGPPSAFLGTIPLYRASQAVAVTWTGTYKGAPADKVDVRYRSAAWNGAFGAYTTWQAGAAASASATLTGSTGRTYCISARSFAAAGGWGPWSAERCAAVPLDDKGLTKSAGWTGLTGAAYYRGTAVRTSTLGRSLTRTGAVARHVALVASTCPACGKVKVYWNGTYQRTVSLASATSRNRVVIGLLSFGSTKKGTLKLVVSTGGRRVVVDGVLITQR
jgi:hypothetical protein